MKSLIISILILAFSGFVHSQQFTKASQGWYVQFSAGQMLPYTDISSSNGFRLTENNNFDLGISLEAGKQWYPGINSEIGIIDGNLNGVKLQSLDGSTIDQSFHANFWQIYAEMKVDFLRFHEITRANGNNFPFDIQVHFGMGPIFYRSVQTIYSTGETVAEYGMLKRESSLICKYGLGCQIFVTKNISYHTEYSWVQSSTDLLDARKGISHNNDMFGCFFMGITYHIAGSYNSLF